MGTRVTPTSLTTQQREWLVKLGAQILSSDNRHVNTMQTILNHEVTLFDAGARQYALLPNELDALRTPALHGEFDTIDDWTRLSLASDCYPDGNPLARVLLIIMNTMCNSAAVERSFSLHKLVQSLLRTRLSIQTIIDEIMSRWNHSSAASFRQFWNESLDIPFDDFLNDQ